MKLATQLRHCLYLNWAIAAEGLPALPDDLRYHVHSHDGTDFAFVTALVVARQSLQLEPDSRLRLSFPQLTLRLYVRDEEGVPAVLAYRILVPMWVVAPLRPWLGGVLGSARFDISSISASCDWQVQGRGALRCHTEPASPTTTAGRTTVVGPDLGSWQQTVEYLGHRERGYVLTGRGMRRIHTRQPDCEAIPVDTTLVATDLVEQALGHSPWPPLHCAFVFPELSFELDTQPLRQAPLGRQAVVPG